MSYGTQYSRQRFIEKAVQRSSMQVNKRFIQLDDYLLRGGDGDPWVTVGTPIFGGDGTIVFASTETIQQAVVPNLKEGVSYRVTVHNNTPGIGQIRLGDGTETQFINLAGEQTQIVVAGSGTDFRYRCSAGSTLLLRGPILIEPV
jgi:hypothetical protein